VRGVTAGKPDRAALVLQAVTGIRLKMEIVDGLQVHVRLRYGRRLGMTKLPTTR